MRTSIGLPAVAAVALALMTSAPLPVVAIEYAGFGLAAAVWPPVRQAWLYCIVPASDRHRANAAMGSVTGLMTMVGADLRVGTPRLTATLSRRNVSCET